MQHHFRAGRGQSLRLEHSGLSPAPKLCTWYQKSPQSSPGKSSDGRGAAEGSEKLLGQVLWARISRAFLIGLGDCVILP